MAKKSPRKPGRPPTPAKKRSVRFNFSLRGGTRVRESLRQSYGPAGKGEPFAAALVYAEAMIRLRKVEPEAIREMYDAHIRSLFREDKITGQMAD